MTEDRFNEYCENLLARYTRRNQQAVTRHLESLCNIIRDESWTLRILSGISEGICNTMVQSGGEFLYIGVGGR